MEGVTPDAQKLLLRYNFPGNIRELENTIERAALLADSRFIEADDLRLGEAASSGDGLGAAVVKLPPTGIALEEIERQALVEALRMSNWVQKDAAELLHISPRVMNYKIKVLGIELPRSRRAAAAVAEAVAASLEALAPAVDPQHASRQVPGRVASVRRLAAEPVHRLARHGIELLIEADDGVGGGGALGARRLRESAVEHGQHFFAVDHSALRTRRQHTRSRRAQCCTGRAGRRGPPAARAIGDPPAIRQVIARDCRIPASVAGHP